ncbi:SLATT domain-containing protein [Paenibacillus oryzisoli]|uniref:SLATT domain-containing protein n=1 Tax=Paenibacillus oryzisoli TaxID=1850517 RepID=UPI003D29995E
MDKLIGEIEHLLNERVWKTKKTRIEAESRLKLNNVLSDIIINYYTFALLAFSIWSLVLDPNSDKTKHIALSTVILSVGLFGITLVMSSIGFKQKALQFKESYLKLDSLENEIKLLLRKVEFKSKIEIIDELYVLETKYNDILSLTDNHNNVDFERLVIGRKLKGINLTLIFKYNTKRFIKWLFIGLLLLFPILLIFLV